MKKRSGFTLIELLIVIGIIAILAGIVIIAVNPTKQFGDANDAQRTSDVNAILNAVSQYGVDNRGTVPTFITDTAKEMTSAATNGDSFCELLVPDYISAMPFDPTNPGSHYTNCSDYATGYQISTSSGRLIVTAPHSEQYDANGDGDTDDAEDFISITR